MKFQFDHNQDYQIKAIEAIVGLFDKLPKKKDQNFLLQKGLQIPNPHLKEIHSQGFFDLPLEFIQEKNKIPKNQLLNSGVEYDDGQMLSGVNTDTWRHPSFSIEMETGTGKTYVYLRTIYELFNQYGFRKFIILVPRVAIYEGVISAYNALKNDLKKLYDNVSLKLIPYDSKNISKLRDFAEDPYPQVLLMTIDSFNKKSNNIYKLTEKLQGDLLPYEYIQNVNPVVIIDEPQILDNTPTAKSAIRTLKPIFTIRYSATHKENINMVYRLTPARASFLNLVKKIKVVGISLLNDSSQNNLLFLGASSKNGIFAKLKAPVFKAGNYIIEEIVVKQGDDLVQITQNKNFEGYKVENIIADETEQAIFFENGEILTLQESDKAKILLFRKQIEETIKQHFLLQNILLSEGIKVLSLFFIDKVANYLGDYSQEKPNGIIRRIFEEEYKKLAPKDNFFQNKNAEDVQGYYFAKKKVKGKDEYLDGEPNNEDDRNAEKEAVKLIMQEKGKLITFKTASEGTDVAFIFAHSALGVGWDNPNVFQICTLNQTVSSIKKRQEIGRGLRISVNQKGERIQNPNINVLTVIANESYKNYVASLQKEYHDDKVDSKDFVIPSDARKKPIEINKTLFDNPKFKEFWEKLTQKVSYKINVDSNKLIEACKYKFPKVKFPPLNIAITKGAVDILQVEIHLKSFTEANKAIINAFLLKDNQLQSKVDDIEVSVDDDIVEKLPKDFMDKLGDDKKILGKLIISSIDRDAYDPFILFKNGEEITQEVPFKEILHTSHTISNKTEAIEDIDIPLFDLIERTSKATNLTRKTIVQIFKNLQPEQKELFIKNPEPFATVFIDTIKKVLREQVASNIKFQLIGKISDNELETKLQKLFPAKEANLQKKTIEVKEKSIYNQVPIDSDIEERFVKNRLETDTEILLYFKFPNAFRISLPNAIGNYNPDWGIIRKDEKGEAYLELVRETKGSLDKEALRFEHEKLKITCAEKYFKELKINYRQITDKEPKKWWEKP